MNEKEEKEPVSNIAIFAALCKSFKHENLTDKEYSLVKGYIKDLNESLNLNLELDQKLDNIKLVNSIDKQSMMEALKGLAIKVKKTGKKAGEKLKRIGDIRLILKEKEA